MHVRISPCSRGTHQVNHTRNTHIAQLSHYPSTYPQWNTESAEHKSAQSFLVSLLQAGGLVTLCMAGTQGQENWASWARECKDVSLAWLGGRLGGYHAAYLSYRQEGGQRVSWGRSLSSSSTMKVESWARGLFSLTQPGLCYSYSGIPSFNGMTHLFSEIQGNQNTQCAPILIHTYRSDKIC